MSSPNKYRVFENFDDFMRSTELHQSGEAANKYDYGTNPGSQLELPFEFERRPEIGEDINSIDIKLQYMQGLIGAAINKNQSLIKRGKEVSPYIENQLNKSFRHLKGAYLRLMDTK